MKLLSYIKKARSYLNGLYDGRIGRKYYFFGILFLLLAIVIIIPLSVLLGFLLPSGSFLSIAIAIICSAISMCFLIAYIIYVFSLHIRRLHDQGNSGWWILLGPLAVFLNLLMKGDKGLNKYGDPSIENSNFFKTIFKIL